MPRSSLPDPNFIHPWARGVRARTEHGGQVLLLDGTRKRIVAVRSLPRSAPRPAVFCVHCGRVGHYALTDRHAYFRHANGELACAPHALESARHQRAKLVLLAGIAKTREARLPLRWTRRCDRCGADEHATLLGAGTWTSERMEARYEPRSSVGVFTFDVAVRSHDGCVLALEVREAHSVEAAKLDALAADGLPVLEIRADAILDDEGNARWTGIAPMPPAFVYRVGDLACPHRCARCLERGDAGEASLAAVVDAFTSRVRTHGLSLGVSCVRCGGSHVLDLWPRGARVATSEDGDGVCVRELDVPGRGVARVAVVRGPGRGRFDADVVSDAQTLVAACRGEGPPVLPSGVAIAALGADSRWVCAGCRHVSESTRELERLLAWAEATGCSREIGRVIANALGVEGHECAITGAFLESLDREPERFDEDPAWRAVALRGVRDSMRTSALDILADHLGIAAVRDGWENVGDLLRAPHHALARDLAEGHEPRLHLDDVQRVAAALGVQDVGWARAAAVASVLARSARDGHTVFPRDRESLERDARAIAEPTTRGGSLVDAASARGIVVGTEGPAAERFALPVHADRERRLARELARLIRTRPRRTRPSPVTAILSAEQRESLALACRLRLSIITGAAGTGKTHALRALVESLPRETWVGLAPTGKAACRLRDALAGRIRGERVGTIHRFLSSRAAFAPTAFLVDEASMLDVETATRLFDRITATRIEPPRVVLVGDRHQLPPVGPGAVLRDLLEAVDSNGGPVVPRVELGVVHRSTATLAAFARDFLDGHAQIDGIETCPCAGSAVPARAAELAITHGLLAKPTSVQILTPTNALVTLIDREVQRRLARTPRRLGRFRDGEKVLCTRNRYEAPRVMNGEIGVLRVVRPTNQLPWAEIDFGGDDVRAPFDSRDLEDFAPAYALTIHKAQGSEWPTVVLALDASTRGLGRELAYTAITRAKHRLIVVGAVASLLDGAHRTTERATSLGERLRHFVQGES